LKVNTSRKLKRNRTRCLVVELPVTDYREALELQYKIVASKNSRVNAADIILILEHPPVFTLGRRGGMENLTVSEAFLKKSGVPVIPVERGGNITYHGPGQLVGYPIIDLHGARLTVTDYVSGLEEIMLRTAGDLGVRAERNPMNRGVWVGRNKLGSIGITVRRGVTFHGFAFNVNPSLEPFKWINPCGLQGVGITSLAAELSQTIPMETVRRTVKAHLSTVFGFNLLRTKLSDIQELVEPQEDARSAKKYRLQ
jgi:lipoate-protein ligase B